MTAMYDLAMLADNTFIDPPNDSTEQVVMIQEMSADFGHRFEYGLSEPELELWKQHALNPPNKEERRQITREFDEFIILQAGILRSWLLWIEPVRHRLLQWHGEPNGAALFVRLGQAISNGIKGSSGECKFPIDDPAWYPFKRDTVIQLSALQSRLRTNPNLTGRRRFPSPAELQEIIDQEIHRSPADFPRLLENSRAFQAFFAHDENRTRLFVLGQLRPAKFCDELVGWSTGYDPEKARQMISHLGKTPSRVTP
jgi:hypothetical protein